MGKVIQHKHVTPNYRSIFRHLWWWTCILCMVMGTPVLAQTSKVTGTVTDEKGQPLSAVSVQVKKSNKAVMTDDNGKFTIDANANATLIFTSTGYAMQEVVI